MVRNPRTLMMCSLLALATGMALGSWLAPSGNAVAPTQVPTLLPQLLERLHAGEQSADAMPSRPTEAPANLAADANTSSDSGLEGNRQPRMPRAPRDASERPMR
ncbi:hypothetical protein [Cognatilysobacter lacus]|uniref:Secreted protein n=1 Tax=Cognatilysobacter lacus TaxID=1643323 RepID=A0A5D8YZW7_9GAMM|nr:hypothetical protein [Lysobacter lacus]TZF88278.1 hypothetical protein FW784_10090 [Lysobacter lacus]